MKVVEPKALIEAFTPNLEAVIEAAGRTCWKSECKIGDGSAPDFIRMIKSKQHASVLEHGAITVRFICDRGVSHELVRHRIASFSQESTRYCNYSKGKFHGEVTFIQPSDLRVGTQLYYEWEAAMRFTEEVYMAMVAKGATPQLARSVLPNSLKTEIVVTANPREWRHILKLRTSSAAHPDIRYVMMPLLEEFKANWPSIFDDIQPGVAP